MLKAGAKIQYLLILAHRQVLCQFYMLSDEVEIASPEALTYIILGLGAYFLLLMRCPSKRAQ